jgi:hypothetical protein
LTPAAMAKSWLSTTNFAGLSAKAVDCIWEDSQWNE